MNEILQVQAQMVKGTSMSHRSLRLQFDTNEGLTDEQMGKAMAWQDKLGWLSFSVAMVKPENILDLPEPKSDESKSPSQRLRNCLFILWKQKGKEGDFDGYYRARMENIINSVKEKLV
jgi:hypothetical protein